MTIEKEKYIDKPINFINHKLNKIINNIKGKQNFTLDKDEVANGIHPHHASVKKNMLRIYNNAAMAL